MSNEADFDAYDHRQHAQMTYRGGPRFGPVVHDYAEALGMNPMEMNAESAKAWAGYNVIPSQDGPSPDLPPTEPATPSEPLVVGLTLRRIPDGGVLVTALDGEVVFCCTAIEEALEYIGDRFGVSD